MSNLIDRAIHRPLGRGQRFFERWVFESTYLSGPGLGLFRIFFAGALLLLLTPAHHSFMSISFMAELPESQFAPPFGPFMLFSGFPSETLLRALEVVLIIGLVALMVGFRTTLSALLVAGALVYLWGVRYSAGKIDHGSVVLIILLVMMTFTPWGRTLSLDALRRRPTEASSEPAASELESGQPAPYQWVGAFLAFVLGLAYLAAGLPKLLGGWLDPSSQAVRNLVDLYSFRNNNPGFLVEPLTAIDSDLLWEAFDVAATFWEVGFILAIFSLRSFRWILATAVIFHMGNALILGIVYYPVLLFYALFMDWDAILASRPVAAIRATLPRLPRALGEWYVAGPALVVAGVAIYALGSPLMALAEWALQDRLSIGYAMLVVATLIAVPYLLVSASRLRIRRPSSERAAREGSPA